MRALQTLSSMDVFQLLITLIITHLCISLCCAIIYASPARPALPQNPPSLLKVCTNCYAQLILFVQSHTSSWTAHNERFCWKVDWELAASPLIPCTCWICLHADSAHIPTGLTDRIKDTVHWTINHVGGTTQKQSMCMRLRGSFTCTYNQCTMYTCKDTSWCVCTHATTIPCGYHLPLTRQSHLDSLQPITNNSSSLLPSCWPLTLKSFEVQFLLCFGNVVIWFTDLSAVLYGSIKEAPRGQK